MNKIPQPRILASQHTRGALMIVVLIYLAILNLMAVSSARITAMNLSMTQNFIARERVFQAAQSALAEAENTIADAFTNGSGLTGFPTTPGTCVMSSGLKLCAPAASSAPPVWNINDPSNNNWNGAPIAQNSILESPAATTRCGGTQSPCFLIERLSSTSTTSGSSTVPTTFMGTIGSRYRDNPSSTITTTGGGSFRITVYATLQAGADSNQKQFVEVMLQSVYGN